MFAGQHRQIGLRGKAMLIVAALITVAVLGASIVSVIRTNTILEKNQQASIDGIGAGLKTAIVLPLAVGDTTEMKRIVEGYLELLPDANFILVQGTNGEHLALAQRGDAVYERYLLADEQDQRLIVKHYAVDSAGVESGMDEFLLDPTGSDQAQASDKLGDIVIGVSNDGLIAAQRSQWQSLIFTLMVVLGVTLPLTYIIVTGWTRRIKQLVRFAGRITKGNYDCTLSDTKKDEIGKLVQAYEHMRLAIKDRNEFEQQQQQELKAARDAADKANLAKSEFLAHMSHEIRTPINGVTGMLELLSMTQLSSKQRRQISTAMSSAQTLLDLVNDILDFSKIEAGHMDAEHIEMDLHDTLESVAEMLACKADEKGIELICDIGSNTPRWIKSDPTKLRQVLINLVNNAIKFTQEGEVVIRAAMISEDDDNFRLRFSVSDTGIGIPPSQRDRLFKSFSQIDASTTRKFGGTGLGLAISKGFVQLMGGEIEINPQRVQGSEFLFSIKAGQCDQEYEQRPVFRGVLRGMRAIIVDDNQTNREIYTEALTNWGLRPEAFPGGNEALDALRAASAEDPFKLAILDMQMPDMDGVMLAEAISTEEQIDTPTMVMLTSMYHTADSDDLENLSLAACLQKPVRLSTLHDALAQYISDGVIERNIAMTSAAQEPLLELTGARALVAEDNSVNQMVISELLKSAGIEVDIVENGALAVTEVCSRDYSFVLMDCQMPEMDGFEATQWIREQESARRDGYRTPIIALTANAIQGDRERCIDAGMDDYLTKPVNAKKLFSTLHKWYNPSHTLRDDPDGFVPATAVDATQPSPASSDPATTSSPAGVIGDQPAQLDIDGALERCAGSSQVFCMVLEEFIRVNEHTEHELREFALSQDHQALAKLAHSLKGSSANIGADKLSEIAKDLENAAKVEEQERYDQLIQDIKSQLNTTRSEIDAYQQSSGGAAA